MMGCLHEDNILVKDSIYPVQITELHKLNVLIDNNHQCVLRNAVPTR